MDGNDMALLIGAQIDALVQEREATQDKKKKDAADEAIRVLQLARAEIIVSEADAFGPLIDTAVANLEEIQNRTGTDAITAIGRTVDRLREVSGSG